MLCLSQEALAEMVGLTRKTVNSYFAEFERKGLIRRTYASTTLLDPNGLRRIAESLKGIRAIDPFSKARSRK